MYSSMFPLPCYRLVSVVNWEPKELSDHRERLEAEGHLENQDQWDSRENKVFQGLLERLVFLYVTS